MQRLIWLVMRLLPEALRERIRAFRYLRALRAETADAEPEFRVVSALVADGDSSVDIGANFGLYTTHLSRLVGERGRVFAFEPVPSTHAILRRNLSQLRMNNVQLFPYAVTDRDGRLKMAIPTWGSGAPNYYMAHVTAAGSAEEAESGIEVECRRLDTVLRDAQRITMVKCDVEGHELSVVRGAADVIRRDQPAWLVEVSSDPDDLLSDAAKLVAMFEAVGYRTYRLHEDNRTLVPRKRGDQAVNYFFLTPTNIDTLAAAGIRVSTT